MLHNLGEGEWKLCRLRRLILIMWGGLGWIQDFREGCLRHGPSKAVPFKIEVPVNGIFGILGPSQRVIMSF